MYAMYARSDTSVTKRWWVGEVGSRVRVFAWWWKRAFDGKGAHGRR